MKRIIIALFAVITLLSINNAYANNYIYTEEKREEESSISTISKTPEFNFSSLSQILIEVSTGKVIYENKAEERILPASVTKVMTMLLTMEAIDSGKLSYSDTITCSANASKMGGSQIWFKEGETLTVDEALKAIAVVSANDVTLAVAEHLGGTEENFVSMMNEKAKELGMTGTNFENCHGIDSENHYTTAKDISLMARELILKHPDILKYTSIWMDTLRNGTFQLSSTNKLIRYYEGANGLKTGYTTNARYNLAASASRNGITFLAVVCSSPSSEERNEDAKKLLDFGFANYEIMILAKNDEVIESIKVPKSIGKQYDVYTDNVNILNEKGTKIEVEKIIELDDFKAPITSESKIGTVKFVEKNNEENILAVADLIIKDEVEKSGFIDYLTYIFESLANVSRI